VVSTFALVAAQTAPSYAQEWRRIYAPDDNSLAGVLNDREVAGMAYMRIPFGGPAYLRKGNVEYGVSLNARMPDTTSTVQTETSRNLASMADLKFSADGFNDLKVSGLSYRQAFDQLNYRSEGEPSAWWTYGLMALAAGVAVVIAVTATHDGSKTATGN
jgi:hypothetical protein